MMGGCAYPWLAFRAYRMGYIDRAAFVRWLAAWQARRLPRALAEMTGGGA